LQNETNALVVPSNHIEALASAIRRLVQNDELKRRFSKNLSDIAREIEWKHIARKIMDVSHP
jgi:glycosyltransferase involved in cell wall biosynthesis